MLAYKKLFDDAFEEVGRVIVGQKEMVTQLLSAILADGNALLEGYPGLAKTLTVRTLARIMDLRFSRIQNTPDLMPSDITGTYVLEESGGKREFKFHPGPIFANIVLADEINRATPKTQSALLEAMQEKQVTVGNTTYKLDLPFFVLATQNPIEQEGSLALDQPVFINGKFEEGGSLIEVALKSGCKIIESNGKKLYKLNNSHTLSLNYEGKLVKSKCWLYSLPYSGKLIKIETEKGRKITVTANHPFVINENDIFVWKKAELLRVEESLACPKLNIIGRHSNNHNMEVSGGNGALLLASDSKLYDIISEKIVSLENYSFSGEVYGLVVPGLQNYVGGFGGCGINHNTYPLPEAQADRFLLKIKVTYPSVDEEMEIVNRYAAEDHEKKLRVVISKEQLLDLQALTRQVPLSSDIKQFVVSLINETRNRKDIIEYGASPRASTGLVLASKARALISGRNHVSIEDIRAMAYPVLRHRIILNFEAERKGLTPDGAVKMLLDKVK